MAGEVENSMEHVIGRFLPRRPTVFRRHPHRGLATDNDVAAEDALPVRAAGWRIGEVEGDHVGGCRVVHPLLVDGRYPLVINQED